MHLSLRFGTPCALVIALVVGCSNGPGSTFAPGDVPPPTDAGRPPTDGYTWDVPSPDIYVNPNPVVVDVEPNHGPFAGGNTVVVRGSNLTQTTVVTFGGGLVQPADTTLTDSHRLSVKPPAGHPGSVDVTIADNGRMSTLPMGYHYDSIYPDPNTGSTAGGDQITIHGLGTHFSDATVVTMLGMPCRVVSVTGLESLSCVTPPNLPGPSDVTVVTGDENIAVPNAYTYSDDTQTITGALGGGPIAGTLDVTVLAGNSGNAIPGAYVFLGTDPTVAPPLSGVTDARGRYTFSIPGLTGPQTLTASAHCFSSHTMQAFDARDALIYLYPEEIPACGMGAPPGGGGGGGIYGAEIQGELVWTGSNEFAPNVWSNIPAPRTGERRVAYVYTTQSNILTPAPAPGDGGTVFEVVTPGYGGRGYPFSILARPAALAVYALAGIENIETQEFAPYVMGVARGILASPRARVVSVSVPMDITLTHETDVTLHGVPAPVNGVPDTVKVEAFIDLGGEGVIARADNTVVANDPTAVFAIVAMPGLMGPLADAALIVRGTYGTSSNLNTPYTVTLVAGITTPDDPVDLANWVGIPSFSAPVDNGLLPTDRTVRFALHGSDPDLFWMTLSGQVFYWQTFAPGSARSFVFPNLATVAGLSDLPAGQTLYMNVTGLNVPSLTFNTFRYGYLSQIYWSAYSGQNLLFAR